MNLTKQTTTILQLLSFGSVISVISFMLLSRVGENGIYTFTVLGAIYEMLWLPSVAALFSLPLAWLIFAFKKKVAWNQLYLPVVLILGTLLYLLVFFT
ncbi:MULTISPECIES: hypothetical protein [unclassified Myroides]|uniref:hypothetical protein n=1 Tax=unclassified Myroides TaxID=2642485 RepID=UPI0015F9B972|nr:MULTISPECIES: hypothetical protein [unclassified Myroides]MBB1150086.1 hypothetical protein [Myroides sp. NP-2]MDM1407236.1 hypothetical protein [Myroides sp. DF42-4-2]